MNRVIYENTNKKSYLSFVMWNVDYVDSQLYSDQRSIENVDSRYPRWNVIHTW